MSRPQTAHSSRHDFSEICTTMSLYRVSFTETHAHTRRVTLVCCCCHPMVLVVWWAFAFGVSQMDFWLARTLARCWADNMLVSEILKYPYIQRCFFCVCRANIMAIKRYAMDGVGWIIHVAWGWMLMSKGTCFHQSRGFFTCLHVKKIKPAKTNLRKAEVKHAQIVRTLFLSFCLFVSCGSTLGRPSSLVFVCLNSVALI